MHLLREKPESALVGWRENEIAEFMHSLFAPHGQE